MYVRARVCVCVRAYVCVSVCVRARACVCVCMFVHSFGCACPVCQQNKQDGTMEK